MPTLQMRAVESFSVVGDTLVASPVRVPAITLTEGIEVSHQGVAIASAYAGTTRIVAMMASGPMPAPVPDKFEGFNENAADFRQYANQGKFDGPTTKKAGKKSQKTYGQPTRLFIQAG